MRACRSCFVALGVVACAVALRAVAQQSRALPDGQRPAALRSAVSERLGMEAFELHDLVVSPTKNSGLSTRVTLGDETVTLHLVLHSMRAATFQAFEDHGGQLVAIDPPPISTYDGTVDEWPEARVAASWRAGRFQALIATPDDRFVVEPLSDLGFEGQTAHIAYRADDLPGSGFSCGVEHGDPGEIHGDGWQGAPLGERSASGLTGNRTIEVGLDADFSYFLENGSNVAATIADMESIMNAVRVDYGVTNIALSWEVTTIIVRSTSDDPYTSNNASTLLDQFQSTWNTAPENAIQRDNAQLFTGINLLPPPIGIANCIGCGCNTFSAYSLVETNAVFGFSSRVALSSHEFGHVWGAFHCNGCGSCSNCCRIMCSGLGGCTGIITSFGCVAENAIHNYSFPQSCLQNEELPAELPFCEDWESPVIDPSRWSHVKGAIPAGGGFTNPPSPPFVIELDAAGSGPYQDDELRSNFVNLAQLSDTVLSYHTQHRGVDAGEELVVEYWSFNKSWIELNRITSNGVDQNQFVYHQHVLGSAAHHDEFRVRFRSEVNGSSDNWYLDDISLDCFPPPICEEPCTDGDACTVGDSCVEEFLCGGSPVDCSAAGDDCTLAACDALGADGNCDILTPFNEMGACNGGSGFCSDGTCVSAGTTTRVFMAGNGQQGAAPQGGPTSVTVPAGGTVRIGVFTEDNSPPGEELNGYQMIIPVDATPLAGASGTVGYLDNDPGGGGGDSVVIDTSRTDWVYADEPVFLTPVYTENPSLGYFGAQYATIQGTGLDISGDGVLYLLEFDLQASGDADGQFELRFNVDPENPPVSAFFNQFGAPLPVDQTQTLLINIGEVDCLTVADCADLNGDGRRDDPCLFYECLAGTCVTTPRGSGSPGGQADMGGFAGCPVDGICDINDGFAAQNCFGNLDTDGFPPFPCEGSPPTPVYNVDAGGFAGSCVLDATCDINDVFHAQNCFANQGTDGLQPYPCQCGAGPAPRQPAPPSRPQPVARTTMSLIGPEAARAGERVEVDIYIDAALPELRGYQLHLGVSGGRRGSAEIRDFSIDEQRKDYVYAAAEGPSWAVFNAHSGQMMNGLDQAVRSTPARAYVGTVSLQLSRDAAGTFVVDLLHDEVDPQPRQRTFLFASPGEPIAVDGVQPAALEVSSGRARSAADR